MAMEPKDSSNEPTMPEKEQSSTENIEIFTNETIDKLTQGFLNILQPEVLRVEQSLNELT